MGRISTFTAEIADEICERLAEGETLTSICNPKTNPNMPTTRTVHRWAEGDKEFGSRFARARQFGCEVVLDKVLDIAHAPLKSDDLAVKPADLVAQRRMQIDAHFKFIARVNPAKYGDRTAMDIRGVDGVSHLSDTDVAAKVAAMVVAVQAKKGENEQ